MLFGREGYDAPKARDWLKKHDYKPIKRVHKTKNTLRYRIRDPTSASRYITKKIGKHIKLVIQTS